MKIRPAGLALVLAAGIAAAASAPACSDDGGGGNGGTGGGFAGSGGSASGGSGGLGGSGDPGGSGGTNEPGGSGGGGAGGSGGTGGAGGSGGASEGGSGGGTPVVCSDGGSALAISLSGSGFGKYDGKKMHGAVAEAGSDRNVGEEQSVVIQGGRFRLTWPALAAKGREYHLTWYVGVDNDDDSCDAPPHDESGIVENFVPTAADCTQELPYAPSSDNTCNYF